MTPIRLIRGALALCLLAACAPGESPSAGAPPGSRIAPQDAPPGTCWDRIVTPALIETVTSQVLVVPATMAPDGRLIRPAAYRTETHQQIVRERQERWFETPCPDQLTPDLIASLQRALAVRGKYAGPINARLDTRTRAAIRAHQAEAGLDSETLSLDTARALGLLAVATTGTG